MPSHQRKPPTGALTALTSGALEVEGRLPWSSNYTFLVHVDHENQPSRAIYKPRDGEQPLADFPPGLYLREIAAYELARSLGWPLVPETVERQDAPYGVGSLQRFIDSDFEQHYFTLLENQAHALALKELAVFDVLVNNADRKAGHCLVSNSDEIWAIDHGLCFHTEQKLRTVIWDFGGEEVAPELLADIERVREDLPDALSGLLSQHEVEALLERMESLVARPLLPKQVSNRQFPWPLV